MLLNLYIIVPIVFVLVTILYYLNENAGKNKRIREAAARSEAGRKTREENQKKQEQMRPAASRPSSMQPRVIKKRPELSEKQQNIIDKIIDDSTFDHIEDIELWGSTEPGGLHKLKGKDAK